jgi:hypothetical protein
MMTRSSTQAVELILEFEVENEYSCLLLCIHLSSGSRKTRKRYGLNVSPSSFMVPLCGWMCPKASLVYIVEEVE